MSTILRLRAEMVVEHARSLAAREPERRSEVHRLDGGWLVLAGPNMFVNQALAVGVDGELTQADLDLVVARSLTVGVTPTVELTGSTHPEVRERIGAAGFRREPDGDTTVMTRSVVSQGFRGHDFTIRPVTSAAELRVWQETSVTGLGYGSTEARTANDAYAAAAHALATEHLAVAFDSVDGRPVGCASTTIREGVAHLGAMATIPAERRRGVQAAMIYHRLDQAHRLGCNLASTSAAAGGASERNLKRHGFAHLVTIERHTLSSAG